MDYWEYPHSFPNIKLVVWKERIEPVSPDIVADDGRFDVLGYCSIVIFQPVFYATLNLVIRSDSTENTYMSYSDFPAAHPLAFFSIAKTSRGSITDMIRKITIRGRGQLLESMYAAHGLQQGARDAVNAILWGRLDVIVREDAWENTSSDTIKGFLRTNDSAVEDCVTITGGRALVPKCLKAVSLYDRFVDQTYSLIRSTLFLCWPLSACFSQGELPLGVASLRRNRYRRSDKKLSRVVDGICDRPSTILQDDGCIFKSRMACDTLGYGVVRMVASTSRCSRSTQTNA